MKEITRETTIAEAGFCIRCINCCKAADIETVGQLMDAPREELLRFRNFGRKSIKEIDEFREQHINLMKQPQTDCEGSNQNQYDFDRILRMGDKFFIPCKRAGFYRSLVDLNSIDVMNYDTKSGIYINVKGRNEQYHCCLELEDLLKQLKQSEVL